MNYQKEEICVSFSEDLLTLRSGSLARVIDWSAGWGRTLHFSINGKEMAVPADVSDFELAGVTDPRRQDIGKYHVLGAEVQPLKPWDGDGVEVIVRSYEEYRKLNIEAHYILYRQLPVIGVQLAVTSAVIPILYMASRFGKERNEMHYQAMLRNVTDSLVLPEFTVQETVEFQCCTDLYDEPVLHHPYLEEKSQAIGNILFAKDKAGRGLFYLLEAPPSMERREAEGYDFLVEKQRIGALAGGFDARDVKPGKQVISHRAVLGIAEDGDSAQLLKSYFRTRRPVMKRAAGAITVNPWGGGDFPNRLNEDFLKRELEAAGRVGADYYQIDDGYEGGGTLSEFQAHNRATDTAWWALSSKLLPCGFEPLVETAKASGVNLSLWFAPSFNQEYRDWRVSADILLAYYRRYGVKVFKLDAVRLESYEAEANFRKLLETLYLESHGEVAANLDVTNGVRGGICEFAEFGTIFLENRYCCYTWPKYPYLPENTLDNVWNLASVSRIQDLQIEVPNPGNINHPYYEENQLLSPDRYDYDYWFAIAMFASPLLWMAPSTLSEEEEAVLKRMTALHKQYRGEWQNALISPIGVRPDGAAITGLYADSGWCLIFRELKAAAEAKLDIPCAQAGRLVASNCQATLAADGTVYLEKAGGWALFEMKNNK